MNEEMLRSGEASVLSDLLIDKEATIQQMQQQLQAKEEENRRLREAAQALVDKMDVIHGNDEYRGVWTMAHVHGIRYAGPTYEMELKALRQVLEESDA